MTTAGADALRAEVERRFATTEDAVRLRGREVTLIRPVSAEALISEEDFTRDERLPYWAELWPSARILADQLSARSGRRRTLLELGCGLGLVSIAGLRAGFDVMATDYYEDALLFTRLNALEQTGTFPRTRMVDWRALPADLGLFDMVVAADVLYERPYAALVADAIAQTLAPAGHALVTDPGRVAAGDFRNECRARGLSVETRTVRWEERPIVQRITVHGIRWK